MVIISRKEFNKDLDEYLSRKREREYSNMRISETMDKIKNLFKKREEEVKKQEYVPESVSIDEEGNAVNGSEEVIEEVEESVPKRSFFARIFGRSKDGDYYEEDVYAEEEPVNVHKLKEEVEDLKETVKILHRWIEKLPSDKINQFKRSDDFVKYKELLDKHDMIKKK